MSICGGIPTLAFAYINGKIKFSNHGKTPSEKQKRTVFRWLAFLLGSFMGCFLFPTYNFTKTYPNGSHWYSVYLWPTFAFTGESGYTLGFRRRIAHSGLHGETGVFRMGDAITTLGTFRTFTNIPGPGVRTANFAAFGSWPGVRSRRTQRACGAAMRLCASLLRGVAAPLGCVIFFVSAEIGICTSGAHGFPRVRGGGGITTLGVLCVLLKRWTAACQSG